MLTLAIYAPLLLVPPRIGVGAEGQLAPPSSVRTGPVEWAPPSLALTLEGRRPIGLQLLAGFGWAQTTTDVPIATRTSQLGVTTSIRGLWWALQWETARVGLLVQAGYRGRFGGTDAELQTQTLRSHGFSVATGLRPEWFVRPRVSLHTQLGVAYSFDDDNTTQTVHQLRLAGNVVGQAGLTIWF